MLVLKILLLLFSALCMEYARNNYTACKRLLKMGDTMHSPLLIKYKKHRNISFVIGIIGLLISTAFFIM